MCQTKPGHLAWVAEQLSCVFQANRIEFLISLGWRCSSAVASSIVDKHSVAADVIHDRARHLAANRAWPAEPLWWTLIIVGHLGGNGLPIGSISCVIRESMR